MHTGLRGFISDDAGNMLPNSSIRVEGINHTIYSAKDGDYWRLLVPRKYNVTVDKPGCV